ncbi:MAG: ECF-type sigma factor [Acidobacteriota bacterium]
MDQTPLDQTKDVTRLLGLAQKGDIDAREALLDRCYQELHAMAQRQAARERQGHSLQATALLHEVYLKLFEGTPLELQNRKHFFAVASKQMRRVLVDYARSRSANKRGGDVVKFSLEDTDGAKEFDPDGLLEVNRVLEALAAYDPHLVKVVECKYFAGMTDKEIAETLGISFAQVRRDWEFASSWIKMKLGAA